MKKFLLLLATLFFFTAGTAGAQQSVLQSGNVTPGHVPYWVTTGIVGDSGTSASSNINTLGVTALGGTPFCIATAKTGSLSRLCMGVSGAAGYITLDSYGGASALPLQFIVNGTTYTVTSLFNGTVRKISTGTGDTATTADQTIAWNSATTGAKAQTLYACSSAVAGNRVIFKDEIGTASTYNITITPASGTIDGSASATIAVDYGATTLQCDGGTNWMVE